MDSVAMCVQDYSPEVCGLPAVFARSVAGGSRWAMVAAPAPCMSTHRGGRLLIGEPNMSKRSILILAGIAAALATSAAFAQSGNKADAAKAAASSTQQDGPTEAEKRAERRARTEAAAAKAKQQGESTRKSGAEKEEEKTDTP